MWFDKVWCGVVCLTSLHVDGFVLPHDAPHRLEAAPDAIKQGGAAGRVLGRLARVVEGNLEVDLGGGEHQVGLQVGGAEGPGQLGLVLLQVEDAVGEGDLLPIGAVGGGHAEGRGDVPGEDGDVARDVEGEGEGAGPSPRLRLRRRLRPGDGGEGQSPGLGQGSPARWLATKDHGLGWLSSQENI